MRPCNQSVAAIDQRPSEKLWPFSTLMRFAALRAMNRIPSCHSHWAIRSHHFTEAEDRRGCQFSTAARSYHRSIWSRAIISESYRCYYRTVRFVWTRLLQQFSDEFSWWGHGQILILNNCIQTWLCGFCLPVSFTLTTHTLCMSMCRCTTVQYCLHWNHCDGSSLSPPRAHTLTASLADHSNGCIFYILWEFMVFSKDLCCFFVFFYQAGIESLIRSQFGLATSVCSWRTNCVS